MFFFAREHYDLTIFVLLANSMLRWRSAECATIVKLRPLFAVPTPSVANQAVSHHAAKQERARCLITGFSDQPVTVLVRCGSFVSMAACAAQLSGHLRAWPARQIKSSYQGKRQHSAR